MSLDGHTDILDKVKSVVAGGVDKCAQSSICRDLLSKLQRAARKLRLVLHLV